MSQITSLTPAQEAMLPQFREKWSAITLSCEPTDWARAEDCLARAYKEGGLEPPRVYLHVPSPVQGAILYGALQLEGDPIRNAVSKALENGSAKALVGVRDKVTRDLSKATTKRTQDRMVSARGGWLRRLWGQYHGWLAYCDALSAIGVKECERLRPLMDLAECAGYCWVMRDVAIISAKHSKISQDEQGRLHCEDGPAIYWASEWGSHGIYMWHETRVPGEWIDEPEKLTAAVALGWQNVEQRRAACEILGWEKVLEEVGAEVVDADDDPEIGILLRCNLPDAPGEQFLKVRCGTGRDFVIPVPSDLKTALEANAWTYDINPKELMKLETRT